MDNLWENQHSIITIINHSISTNRISMKKSIYKSNGSSKNSITYLHISMDIIIFI
jgi:hypothetical protein